MRIDPPTSWKHEFARSVEPDRYREIVRRVQEDMRREERRRKDKEEEREEGNDDIDDVLDVVVLATATEIHSFDVTVGRYETATYDALIANERLRDELERQREEMLDKAFVLPDGRRVFESEDGVRVFDEFGNELDPTVITPEEIDDWRPKAEAYRGLGDSIQSAMADRKIIIEYQDKLADARERADSGEITSNELKALEHDLAQEMPDSVREQLSPEYRPELTGDNDMTEEPEVVQPVIRAAAHDAPTF